jgi:phosphopantothenoylcysteine decarboxylase/phosphopantothenate--cysteine ligase
MSEGMEKRKIVLGVTGSIAAYKAAELARILVTRGYEVRVILTDSGAEFITPLTMRSLTGNHVTTGFWDESETAGIGHIQLADWAEAVVIAPATADFIAKLASGFAESPLLAVALATKAPILLAPAMNSNMYSNKKTQENILELQRRGMRVLDTEEGDLACGWKGAGRLVDPEEIFFHVRKILSPQDFAGKRILITTGPTREALDPVRFITNRSSGKMGVALAREAFRRGAEVTLIHGPVHVRVPLPVRTQEVFSTADMREAVMSHVSDKSGPPDVVIMAAAVADYRPADVADSKIKKSDKTPTLKLVENPDILQELGEKKVDDKKPVLVGFAVETGEIEDLLVEARTKLKNKKADMIVGNFAHEAFDLDTNRVWLVDKHGRQEEVATTYKSRVANKILDAILTL